MTHIKWQKLISTTQVHEYNMQFLSTAHELMKLCYKWWALHAATKRQFFTFMFAVYLPNCVISILALLRWLCPSSLTELSVSANLLCWHAKFHPNMTIPTELSHCL